MDRVGFGLQEESLEQDGRVHKINLLQMDNAVLTFCFEGTMKIGTLAISTPGLRDGAVGTSSVLLGAKYMIATRALAERSAAIFNKMSLVSLNTELAEGEALRLYSSLLDKARGK
ncbi:MAG TPA: hypothetical protein VE955_09000 [Candidatus Dormibacteraeota bacterium]|jgi:hypothetical protein|nr:hypothetical protein [Candidatus Dormibacteraeota bacterium]